MSRLLQTALATMLVAGGGTTLANGNAYGHCNKAYEVTVTNLTYDQVLSPPLVVSHAPSVQLYSAGDAASEGIEALAEGGDTSLLSAALSGVAGICDVVTAAGPVRPGSSAKVTIHGSARHLVSAAAMLVNTNDAFAGLNGLRMPRSFVSTAADVPAFDAGTEINDEICANIPGPACGGIGTDASDGEGFVHVHRGINGVGDLDPAVYDWRTPVAHIRIQRLR